MSKETAKSPWRLESYRSWFVADTATGIGAQFRNLALPLLVLFVSGSLAQAGLMTTATTLIRVALSPIGGVLLDRMDRRTAMYVYAAVSTVVWAAVTAVIVTGNVTVVHLWVASVITAVNGALLGAASDVALLSIAQGGTYAKAMASNQGRDAFLGLVAPPVGGALYGLTRWSPFLASAIFSLIMLPAAKLIRADLKPPTAERRSLLTELIEGFAYAWSTAERRVLMVMVMFVNVMAAFLLGGVSFYLMDIGTSAFLIGVADAVAGAAMLLGALVAPKVMDRLRPGPAIVGGMLWFAAAFVITAVYPHYWGLVVGQALAALPLTLVNSLVGGYYFATVRLAMQGRVHSVLGVASGGLSALPPALLGFLLPAYGYRTTAVVAIAAIVLGALAFGATRTSRTIPRVSEWPSPEA